MTTPTAEDFRTRLKALTTRTVHVALEPGGARVVGVAAANTLSFVLCRVNADEIQSNLLFAVLDQDAYASYAAWLARDAAKRREEAQAPQRAKNGEPPPFDDAPEVDTLWRTHHVALTAAADEAVLKAGMHQPQYDEVSDLIAPFRSLLVRELVQWGREGTWAAPKPGESAGEQGNALSRSSDPP